MTVARLHAEKTTVLLIDHQVGTMGWVGSTTVETMQKNALALAKAAKALDMPLVLTSSMEDHAQGPLFEALQAVAPDEFAARVQRQGVVDAMDDENFAKAVKDAGRKTLLIAGVTNDVCTVFPALTAIEQGYEVFVVADAGGSPTADADRIALARMTAEGVHVTSTNQTLAELAGSWTSSEGSKILPIVNELLGA